MAGRADCLMGRMRPMTLMCGMTLMHHIGGGMVRDRTAP